MAKAEGLRELINKNDKGVSIPHTDQDISISEDEEQNVVLCNIMEIGVLLIGKEKVWFPQTLEHVWVNSQCITLKVSRKS